ncbi:MAG: hypothetical protein H0X38_09020, partial [Planctomycetes bacterium]|nr:hypothetical protein [Planctomycetota bacterium]
MLGLTSAVGLLLSPRALLSLFRRKPCTPLLLMAVGLGAWAGLEWLMSAPGATARAARAQVGLAAVGAWRTDWAQVALALIAQEAEAQAGL